MKGKILHNEQGQVLLIVILLIVVAVTVGLSIASRSLTNLRISTDQAESQKALAAAEAGIEQAIKSNSDTGDRNFGAGTGAPTYNAKFVPVAGNGPFLVAGGNVVERNDGADVWLSNYNDYSGKWSGTLNIYWGESSTACNNSAIEVVAVVDVAGSPQIKKYAYDPCSSRQSSPNGNNFTLVTPSSISKAGKTFYNTASIVIANGYLARVIPLYGNAVIAVEGNPATLPNQGNLVTSLGKAGQTQRRVSVFQSYPSVPLELFPYSFFAP